MMDNYGLKTIILDDSILDIDSWFPQDAIDDLVKILSSNDNVRNN